MSDAAELAAAPRDRFVRKAEAQHLTGLPERTLRWLEERDQFPKRVRLIPSGRAVAWLESEIFEWIADTAGQRGQPR